MDSYVWKRLYHIILPSVSDNSALRLLSFCLHNFTIGCTLSQFYNWRYTFTKLSNDHFIIFPQNLWRNIGSTPWYFGNEIKFSFRIKREDRDVLSATRIRVSCGETQGTTIHLSLIVEVVFVNLFNAEENKTCLT
jgi:hypothetical protein